MLCPQQQKIACSYIFGKKNLACLCVDLLWICQIFSVSCKIVYRWVMTNCCVIWGIFITARKRLITNFHHCNHFQYYKFYSCVFYSTNRIYKILLICGNKMPPRCNRWFLLHILLLAQHVSGTIMPIIRSSRVLYKWLLPVVFGARFSSFRYCVELRVVCPICPQIGHTTLSSTPYRQLENRAPNTTGSNHLYNTLELLMMGIIVPETCWASNNMCNKNHLLHLVGILFPHINDDARSKPH